MIHQKAPHRTQMPPVKYLDLFNEKEFVYFTDTGNNDALKINDFSPTHLSLFAQSTHSTFLIVKQNFYPFWRCKVNSNDVPIDIEAKTLMKIRIREGKNHILLTFSNKKIVLLLCFQLLIFTLSSIALIINLIRKINK